MKFSSWNKLCSRIKKLKGTDWLIVLLVGVLLLVIAIPTGSVTDTNEKSSESLESSADGGAQDLKSAKNGSTSKSDGETAGEDSVEEELAEMLSCMEGVGDVRVMITWKGDGTSEANGVFVVAQGADNAAVCADILSAVQALFSIEAHKITIAKMSVSEGAN